MKVRKIKGRFWWTWHHTKNTQYSTKYGWFDWGVGRILHQGKKT